MGVISHHLEIVNEVIANAIINIWNFGDLILPGLLGVEVFINLLPSLKHQQ